MCSSQVLCPRCGSDDIRNFGYSAHNVPRYLCCNNECEIKSFMLEYRYKAYEPGVKEQVIDMAINGSGIRDTSRVVCSQKVLEVAATLSASYGFSSSAEYQASLSSAVS